MNTALLAWTGAAVDGPPQTGLPASEVFLTPGGRLRTTGCLRLGLS